MAIKLGEKDLFPYLGDYGPVSIYKGEQKLAGYKWAEKSGQELHFDNTYNSSIEVEVDGQSYQHGTPSPDYPIEIHSLNDFDVVSSVEKLSEGQLQECDYGVEYENVDKINLSLSEPLRSVGDVKDRLFRDSDGLWKIERNVGEKTFNDSRRWSHHVYSNTEKDNYETRLVTTVFGQHRQIISDRFIGSLNQNPPINHIRMSSSGFLNFAVEKGMINNLSEWFSQNPFTILYEEVPSIETLDQEQQHQLNTLKSFKGSNYVYTVNNTDNPHEEQLKPTLHAKTEVKDI